MKTGIVITGIGIVSPLRPFEGTDHFWRALCSGEDSIKIMKPPLLDLGREWPMAAIDEFAFPERVNKEDKVGFLAKKALSMALNDSGLDISSHGNGSRAGLVLGTVLGNILSKEVNMITSGIKHSSDMKEDDSLSSIACGLARSHDLTGPVLTVSTACASGTDAVGIASRRIAADKADIMLAGGVDVLSDFAIAGFNSLKAITEDKVRPFDKNRGGLALGEGAAFLVLESEQHARERGAVIYGKVAGYAARSDANHLTGPHRDGRGLAEAIKSAVADAETAPEEIDYVNAHGTGTLYNDLMETKALKLALGASAYKTSISSTKSMLGHSFGAAGAIEVICCLLAMKTGTIPPTINFQEKDSECDLDYTHNIAREKNIRTSMSMSAGFGGQNSAVVLTTS